jgi:hypothetical protein
MATAACAAVGLLATGPALAAARAPASQSGTGRIYGLVTGSGHPLTGICVDATNKYTYQFYDTKTSKRGRYSLSGVQPGRYYVTFVGCPDQGNWLYQWYKGANSPHLPPNQPPPGAVLLRVKAGTALTGIDGRLKAGASISGTVTDASTGKGVKGACVEVATPNLDQFGLAFHLPKSGNYTIHALFPGNYVVRFGCGDGNYAPQWWRYSATAAQATPLRITGAQNRLNIDAKLGPGGVISGTVYGANSSGPPVPLPNVCVYAASTKPKGNSSDGDSGSGGSYSLTGLATGTYTLTFDPLCGGGDGYSPSTVKGVQVTAGATTSGINVDLPVCTKNCMANITKHSNRSRVTE